MAPLQIVSFLSLVLSVSALTLPWSLNKYRNFRSGILQEEGKSFYLDRMDGNILASRSGDSYDDKSIDQSLMNLYLVWQLGGYSQIIKRYKSHLIPMLFVRTSDNPSQTGPTTKQSHVQGDRSDSLPLFGHHDTLVSMAKAENILRDWESNGDRNVISLPDLAFVDDVDPDNDDNVQLGKRRDSRMSLQIDINVLRNMLQARSRLQSQQNQQSDKDSLRKLWNIGKR